MSEILETETETFEVPEATEPAPKSYQCRHIHTAGRRCGSASLRGEHFCYYHHTTRTPAPRHDRLRLPRGRSPSNSHRSKTAPSVRFAVAQVLARIATNQLDNKRAGLLLLYGLQIAATTSPREPRDPRPSRLSQSRHNRNNFNHPSKPQPNPSLIEDLILDPDLGPIAPIAEVAPPPPREKALRSAPPRRDAQPPASRTTQPRPNLKQN